MPKHSNGGAGQPTEGVSAFYDGPDPYAGAATGSKASGATRTTIPRAGPRSVEAVDALANRPVTTKAELVTNILQSWLEERGLSTKKGWFWGVDKSGIAEFAEALAKTLPDISLEDEGQRKAIVGGLLSKLDGCDFPKELFTRMSDNNQVIFNPEMATIIGSGITIPPVYSDWVGPTAGPPQVGDRGGYGYGGAFPAAGGYGYGGAFPAAGGYGYGGAFPAAGDVPGIPPGYDPTLHYSKLHQHLDL